MKPVKEVSLLAVIALLLMAVVIMGIELHFRGEGETVFVPCPTLVGRSV